MAQVENIIEPMIGKAQNSMHELLENGYGNKVDFIFVDADKSQYPEYYELGLKLLRPHGLMMFDNMLRNGRIIEPAADDRDSLILRDLAQFAKADKRVEPCFIGNGDGILMVQKR